MSLKKSTFIYFLLLLSFIFNNTIQSAENKRLVPNEDGIKIDKKKESIVIYYGTKDEGLDYLCYTASIVLDTAEFNINVELLDLLPDTNYFFIIKKDDTLSQQYSFKTPKAVTEESSTLPPGNADFTVIALPDTQHYTYSPTNFQLFIDQTQWIINQKVNLNIVLVDHLGDIVDYSEAVQWQRARQALNNLNQSDIAIGVAPGNHDYNAINANTGEATLYDKNFPATTAISIADGLGIPSYEEYPWYGGYMGGTNDVVTTDDENYTNRLWKNNYVLFSAGGMDFINIALEFNFPFQSQQWLNDVLDAFPDRRAIISTHGFIRDDNSVTDSGNVQAVLNDVLAQHCNVFLILCAHYHGDPITPGEAELDLINSCGKPLYIRMSNYQEDTNGGNGFLRMMKFRPSRSVIEFKTYSPVLNQYRTQTSSQFTLPYDMSASSGITLAITAPTNNQVFSNGVATIPVTVNTNAVVDFVEFKFNGQTLTDTDASDTTFGVVIPNTSNLPSGTYTIEVIAHDVQTSNTLVKYITFKIGVVSGTIDVKVNASNNDAEENRFNNGSISLTSSDLELYTDEETDPQYVGLRFANLAIPQNATITSAYIKFTVDEINSGNVTINIAGQAADNPPAYTTTAYDISSRTRTTAIVNWNPDAWLHEYDVKQTPSLNSVVQEIVNRQGWNSGNAMAFILYGGNLPTNTRIAKSFDGQSNYAPVLHVEYVLNPCLQQTFYADVDGDGFGNSTNYITQCEQPVGYVTNNLDCDDLISSINPNATEICWNNIDDNCDGSKSEGCAAITISINNPIIITNFATSLSASIYNHPGASSLGYFYQIKNLTNGQVREFIQTGVFARYFTIPTDIRGYATQYQIRVAAVINDEIAPFGLPSITVTSQGIPAITLNSAYCNSTLATLNSTIAANSGFNANYYRFRIRKASDIGQSPTYYYVQTSNRFLSANSFIGLNLQYETAYSISVQYSMQNNGIELLSDYGEECIINTPSLPIIGLSAPTCGSQLTTMSTTIAANPVIYAIYYQFRIRLTSDTSSTPAYYYTIPNSSRFSSLSAFQGIILNYDTQYSISVHYKMLVNGIEIWSNYGAECILKTPYFPTTEIAALYCDSQITDLNQTYDIIPYVGFPTYKILLEEVVDDEVITVGEIERNYSNFKLNMFEGAQLGKNYSVSVAIKINGVFGPFGKSCDLNAVVARESQKKDIFEVKISPNPFNYHFNINLVSSSDNTLTIKIYDTVGRLIEDISTEADKVSTLTIGERYPSGVYNIIISQDDNQKSLRIIKR